MPSFRRIANNNCLGCICQGFDCRGSARRGVALQQFRKAPDQSL